MFLAAAATCLGLSAGYHTMMNHSEEGEGVWLRLDLVGIVVLVLGAFWSGVYVVFWCEARERGVYWAMVSDNREMVVVVVVMLMMG